MTARLIVRRVKDARYPDALFPVWRYHPFFTDTDRPRPRGRYHSPPPRDHRNHFRRPHRRAAGPHPLGTLRRQLGLAVVRSDRPQPAARHRGPGRRPHSVARGATLRRNRDRPCPAGPPATTTRPAPTQPLALGEQWRTVAQHHRRCPPPPHHSLTIRRKARPEPDRKSWADQQIPPAHHRKSRSNQAGRPNPVHRWIEA